MSRERNTPGVEPVPVETILSCEKLDMIYNYWESKLKWLESEDNSEDVTFIKNYLDELIQRRLCLGLAKKEKEAQKRKQRYRDRLKREKEEEKALNIKVQHIVDQLNENYCKIDDLFTRLTKKNEKLSTIRQNTKKEYAQMIKEFENKHGITQLNAEIETLENNIKQLRNAKICDHPASYRMTSSKGWRGSWCCSICKYEEIDHNGPGN